MNLCRIVIQLILKKNFCPIKRLLMEKMKLHCDQAFSHRHRDFFILFIITQGWISSKNEEERRKRNYLIDSSVFGLLDGWHIKIPLFNIITLRDVAFFMLHHTTFHFLTFYWLGRWIDGCMVCCCSIVLTWIWNIS